MSGNDASNQPLAAGRLVRRLRWTNVARRATLEFLIKSFRHKGLKGLFETGRSAEVPPQLRRRCANLLEVLDQAENLNDLSGLGFGTHPLHTKPPRYAMAVNGPWRITFQFEGRNALLVDLEQYH
jgi:proteic killer suppression protein